MKMNFKIFFLSFLFVLQLSQISGFSTEVDFSTYRNKSERDLVDDTEVNWVRTDYENAYVCQGTRIKNDRSLLRLLPRRDKFMATYIYARPRFGQSLTGDLTTYPLSLPTTNGMVHFTYSQDQDTSLEVWLWRRGRSMKLIWKHEASNGPTDGVVMGNARITNLDDEFKLVFRARVEAVYPYTFRTYLSQVVIGRVVVQAS